jgi:8-amino-7-oxononanoate synthase
MDRFAVEIERLKATNSYRTLRPASGLDFTSNDYLGLAAHPALREAAKKALDEYGIVGVGGSRLLRGHHPLHAALETHAADFFACEKTLYFSSGYLANLALFSTLCGRRDAVVFDETIHASMKEGIHTSPADRYRARHNDISSFEENLKKAHEENHQSIWIAVESLYSMDGDFAPLDELAMLARNYDATLIIDEAHSTGVFGKTGRGLSEGLGAGLSNLNTITVHTCGKALGVAGALVCGSALTIDFLINKARPFIFSTAPPPMLAASLIRALELIDEEPERRKTLIDRVRFSHKKLKACAGDALCFSGSQILPVILGEEDKTLKIASDLQGAGFDVHAIRPPTVPQGTSRLRISINAMHSEDDIAVLSKALSHAMEKFAR